MNGRISFLPLLATLESTFIDTTDSDSSSSSSTPLPQLFPDLSDAIQSLGISTPTPIQQASAVRALQGDDLLLVAPTGSGKTLAYLLPALTKAMQEDGTILVVAPTRELAVQVREEANRLAYGHKARCVAGHAVLPWPTVQATTIVVEWHPARRSILAS